VRRGQRDCRVLWSAQERISMVCEAKAEPMYLFGLGIHGVWSRPGVLPVGGR
jgi:hypothetical protein